MTKNISILNGSPRQKGNTAAVIDLFQNAAIAQNFNVKKHDLYKLNFRGCAHCDACVKVSDKHGCVLKDDFIPVLDELTNADVIVIASPVYCWSVTGCTCAALDRFYAFVDHGQKFLMQNKKMIGLFSAGGSHFDGMELCVTMLKHLCEFAKVDYVGTIAAANCTTPSEIINNKAIMNNVDAILKLL
jgi:multimeric flavodoxin WrbA